MTFSVFALTHDPDVCEYDAFEYVSRLDCWAGKDNPLMEVYLLLEAEEEVNSVSGNGGFRKYSVEDIEISFRKTNEQTDNQIVDFLIDCLEFGNDVFICFW